MEIEYAHEECPHCKSYLKQALRTIEELGFDYIRMGNTLGHNVKVEKEETK
jgi:hypothetical protein